ncbi:unnamed protein product [Nesidiocoris tenuis]|uniref:Uncharacterized protein n=1 Tax=Nesidiocoris tenuis TaxID=355587 RepID=A0A6H5H8G2_9HEMI|nr:unnamed protein product [Nesidiocoris tenuis]
MIEKLLKINIGLIWRFRHISAAGRSTGHFLWRLSRPIVTPVTYVVSLPSRTFRTVTTTPCWRHTKTAEDVHNQQASKDIHTQTDIPRNQEIYVPRLTYKAKHSQRTAKDRHTQTGILRHTSKDIGSQASRADIPRQTSEDGYALINILKHTPTEILRHSSEDIHSQTAEDIHTQMTSKDRHTQADIPRNQEMYVPRLASNDRHTQADIPRHTYSDILRHTCLLRHPKTYIPRQHQRADIYPKTDIHD